MNVDEIRELDAWDLAELAGTADSFRLDSAGARVLVMARDWYLAYRALVCPAVHPARVIRSAARLEAGEFPARHVRLPGYRTVKVALPGALPPGDEARWAAFTDLAVWRWGGIDASYMIESRTFSRLTAAITRLLGEVTVTVVTRLRGADDGEPDTRLRALIAAREDGSITEQGTEALSRLRFFDGYPDEACLARLTVAAAGDGQGGQ